MREDMCGNQKEAKDSEIPQALLPLTSAWFHSLARVRVLLSYLSLQDLPGLFLADAACFLLHKTGLLRQKSEDEERRLYHKRQREF